MTQNISQKKIEAAVTILREESMTVEKIKSVSTLVAGINPKIDKLLSDLRGAIETIQKVQEGEVVDLAVERLPEKTEEEKKRKKALLFFLRLFRQLEAEVERVKNELEKSEGRSTGEETSTLGRILAAAKGPFGIVTIAAFVIVLGIILLKPKPQNQITINPFPIMSPKTLHVVRVIDYQNKKIALTELDVREGPDCDGAHYHAKNQKDVSTFDGEVIVDPGGCAFGKVAEVAVEEIVY